MIDCLHLTNGNPKVGARPAEYFEQLASRGTHSRLVAGGGLYALFAGTKHGYYDPIRAFLPKSGFQTKNILGAHGSTKDKGAPVKAPIGSVQNAPAMVSQLVLILWLTVVVPPF